MDWTKVVMDPLGLAAFTLAVVFGVVAVKGSASTGMKYIAIGLAAIAVVGGLGVSAYREKAVSDQRILETQNKAINGSGNEGAAKVGKSDDGSGNVLKSPEPSPFTYQRSEGTGAANVSNVGSVTINVSGVDVKK